MIDTIKVAHIVPSSLLSDALLLRGWEEKFDEFTGKPNRWSYKEKKGSKYPYLHLFTAPDGVSYLSARISLPAFVFGSNVCLPNQIQVDKGLSGLSEYVSGKLKIKRCGRRVLILKDDFMNYLNGEN